MLNRDSYYNTYNFSNDRINFLKYGLINEYGFQDSRVNFEYCENAIIKKKCHIKKTPNK